ncbi:MAG: hypothetical protein HC896_00040 [Bacteroidales bacterium]|nr:hypothetical protein [Bacteroidales bacterium]
MKSAELIGQATPEQIEQWKAKHGKIWHIKVDGHIGYFKKPDRRTMSAASTMGLKDPVKFNEQIMLNCQIGGSDELQKNDELFFAAGNVLGELVQFKQAEIKNL